MKYKRKMKKSAGKNIFNTVLVKKAGRNMFDLSHSHTTSFNMGELIPISAVACLPEDYVHVNHSAAVRLQPMLSPIFHRVNVYTHSWFVPYRILWEGFEDFITNGGAEGDPPAAPFISVGIQAGDVYSRLLNYLGIPDPATHGDGTVSEEVIAFFMAAYQKIWNEWYRDENLISPINVDLENGNNSLNADLIELRKRAWGHDYLTSCLPFAQKGQPVQLPIQEFGDVEVKMQQNNPPSGDTNAIWNTTGIPSSGVVGAAVPIADSDNPNVTVGELYADTSTLNANATTINDLRTASATQRFLEMLARVGSRFAEFVRGFWGGDIGDARLDRPEYITGSVSPVNISEVLNTTGTEELPQGNMAGHGISILGGNGKGYKVREHGVLMTLASVLPITAYQDGIHREFKKFDPLDYWNPQWDGLGEQAVANSEVYAFTPDGSDTWGYIPKGAEHRYMNNLTTGDFQTDLDYWTMTRKFAANLTTTPALNSDFIECDATHRIFAVTDPSVQKVLAQFIVGISASRMMSKFGTPRLW